MPEHSEPEQLYVVVNVEPSAEPEGRRVTVTDPKPLAEAERFACEEAWSFAGRLEVVPATQADLDDADEGDERGVSEYHAEEFALDRGDDTDGDAA